MTNPVCNVCCAELPDPVFQSAGRSSLTSLCELRPEETVVRFCHSCGHTQTDELTNAAEFYDQDYRILVDSDDEDQLYEIRDGVRVFRLEHQTQLALQKVNLPQNARVLDFGAAKAASLKKLIEKRPDLAPHVFDVSRMYQSFWDRFLPAEQQACYQLKSEWDGTFDLVTSWFVLEHVSDLRAALADVFRSLKPGGQYLLTVPNVFANTADFVVVDHVNHFSAASMQQMLQTAGFTNISIDTSSYRAAYVVLASRPTEDCVRTTSAGNGPAVDLSPGETIPAVATAVNQAAAFWRDITDRIRRQETALPDDQPRAIYGAGFYGSYILTQLQRPDLVNCLVDANEYLWGTDRFNKPVRSPSELPDDLQHIFVGLNPAAARDIVPDIDAWKSRDLNFLFLDQPTQHRSAA